MLFRSWALPSSVKETLLGWQRFFLGKGCKKPWKAAPLCIFWTVWKERSMRAFDNVELSVQRKESLITSFSIVQRQGVFGSYYLLSLGYLGPSPPWLKRHSSGGKGLFWVKFVKSLGRLPLMYFFGLFGKKGTCVLLIMLSYRFKERNH